MRMSPEMEAQYERNRLKKAENDENRRRCFWIMLILGMVIFATSFLAGAMSAKNDSLHGSTIFYVAFTAGVFQILLGLTTMLIGWLNYREIRIPSLIYIAICVLLTIYFLLHLHESFSAVNIIFLLAGIGLSAWSQVIFHTEDALKEEPGYPLFSPEASQPARYELPKDVIAAKAKASQHMDTIGGPAAPSAAPMPSAAAPTDPLGVRLPDEVRLPEVHASAFGLEADLGSGHAPLPVPEITGDVTLEGFAQAEGGVKEKGVDALPQVSAADLLMDMTAAPSHATVKGDVSQLPDPAEVRARMAAMKKAREEHPLS